MIEPQKHTEFEEQILAGEPAPKTYADAIRMRVTLLASLGLLVFIFFRVIF